MGRLLVRLDFDLLGLVLKGPDAGPCPVTALAFPDGPVGRESPSLTIEAGN